MRSFLEKTFTCFLVTVLFCLSLNTQAQEAPLAPPPPPFESGKFASQLIEGGLLNLKDKMTLFTPDILPHQVKYKDRKLRKQILYLRTYIDLFGHSFSLKPSQEEQGKFQDPWRELRSHLDDGYDYMGDFKDLYDILGTQIKGEKLPQNILLEDYGQAYHVHPNLLESSWLAQEINQRRKLVLDWIQGFDFQAYLTSLKAGNLKPLENNAIETRRSRKKYSKLFWGSIHAAPDTRLSGLDNIRRLCFLLLTDVLLSGIIDEVSEIENIILEQEIFHDLRKRIRSVIQIPNLAGFESLLLLEDIESTSFKNLSNTVSLFGDINDLITKHALFSQFELAEKDPAQRAILKTQKEETLVEIAYHLKSSLALENIQQLKKDIFDLAMIFARRILPTQGQAPPPIPAFITDITFDPLKNVVFHNWAAELKENELAFAVEIPTGSNLKTELRTATGQVIMDRVLCPRSVLGTDRTIEKYPVNYGISPGRFNVDGDPLDLLVIGKDDVYKKQVETNTVTLRKVRVIGAIKMQECETVPCETEESWLDDWKVVAVDVEEKSLAGLQSLDAAPEVLSQLTEFFSNYKGSSGGNPLTRVTGHFDGKEAIAYIKNFKPASPDARVKEIELCCGLYDTVLENKDFYLQVARPNINKSYLNCLARVFYTKFFENEANYNFFIQYSAYQLAKGKLGHSQATMANALEVLKILRDQKAVHYRFVTYDTPEPGSGNAIFEWVKTQNRNVGCPDAFPAQHYESQALVPTYSELQR